MANPYKIEFKLKQHTPIIHFQHDQDGATLRATELKPKLDRFLLSLKRNEVNDFIKITNDGREFLDYKVKIYCNSSPLLTPILKPFPCFFAAMGNEYLKNPKYFSNTISNINLDFFCFNEKLKNIIKEEISHFFAITNFGTRQNKGFGSFYPIENSEGYKDINEILNNRVIKFTYQSKMPNEILFQDIDYIYKIMKSGYNFPHHQIFEDGKPNFTLPKLAYQTYIKSFLLQYFLNNKIGNEKRFIKENFFDKNVQIASDSMAKKYVRAQLGVTDNFEFKGKDRKGKVTVKSNEIDRFKSPILIKVFDNQVFILCDNSILPPKKFIFSEGIKKESIESPNFVIDFEDFFKKYVDYFNSEKKAFFDKISIISGHAPNPISALKESFSRISLSYISNDK